MKISKVTINNFRCFNEEKFDWFPQNDLNLLIGPNGSGKTALIDAIDIVVNSENRSNRALISEYDFPFCDTDKKIEIEVILTEPETNLGIFEGAFEFYDENKQELFTDLDDKDESKYKRAIRIKFEASLNHDDGEIEWCWILPKFIETDDIKAEELTRKQHEAIGYFRINPAISAGAFTLNQYSALGRRLRKLKYRLGKIPDRLKPDLKLPQCNFKDQCCDDCPQKKDCQPNQEESTETETIGEYLGNILSHAEGMLGENSWGNMKSGLGPRYGGLKSSLAAITLGLLPQKGKDQKFIPFERLSAGEKYALSFSLAITQIPNTSLPIVIMEEPETALYPAAIGQMISKLQSFSSDDMPQIIITSHSEAVIRCFAIEHIFSLNIQKDIKPLSGCLTGEIKRMDFEYLIMPGRTSALFAEKIIVAEGAMDAIVSGELNRLAGLISSSDSDKSTESFATKKWTFFDAGSAEHVKKKADALGKLGKRVVLLYDGDTKGVVAAESSKSYYPTFIYKHQTETEPTLELALLYGLDQPKQANAIRAFQSFQECTNCTAYKDDIYNCLKKNGCSLSNSKNELKEKLNYSCLDEYKKAKTFPPAFKSLLDQIDSAQAGNVIELEIEKG